MKLGLLVLLAVVVAVLVPSLSEGRVVSKCELKRKLSQRLNLPRWFNRTYKNYLLAVVICELNRTSHLTTDMVDVWSQEETLTTTTPETTLSTYWIDEMEEETNATSEETSLEEMNSEAIPEEEMNNEADPKEEMNNEADPEEEMTTEANPEEEMNSEANPEEEMNSEGNPEEEMNSEANPEEEMNSEANPEEEMNSEGNPEEEMNSEANPEEEMTTEATTTKATTTQVTTTETTEPTTTEPSTPETSQTTPYAGKRRRKREVVIFNEEDEWTNFEFELEEKVNVLQSKCDEEEIDRAEIGGDNEDSDSSEDQILSLRRYGVFQLSDGYFCDSGLRHSKNKCNSKCSDFTDEDISNDIDCFVKIGCWKKIFQTRSHQCFHPKNYFSDLELRAC